MSTTIATAVGSQASSHVRSLFQKAVIERLSKYRANNFVDALVDAIRDERDHDVPEEDVNHLLEKLVKNEQNAEAVFEAYRRVSSARSRDIGPRMIGYLTAALILEHRQPTTVEDAVFDVAEHLNDSELREIVQTVREWTDVSLNHDPDMAFEVSTADGQMQWTRTELLLAKEGQGASTGGVLLEVLGPWGEKLRTYGLLTERVRDRAVKGQGPTSLAATAFGPDREITYFVVFQTGYKQLVDLIDRADRAAKAAVK